MPCIVFSGHVPYDRFVLQQVRKLILEMMYRIPTDKYLKPYAEQILNVAFKLLETENEENVHVCLRIIIELHKHYRPVYNAEVHESILCQIY